MRITYADAAFLFATKLIALRAKDADDLVALARRLGMASAIADDLEAYVRGYYTNRPIWSSSSTETMLTPNRGTWRRTPPLY